MSMRILVTGATGFIGERLVQRLIQNNHFVVGTARRDSNAQFANYKFIAANLAQSSDCFDLCKDIDAVIHCAGKAGVWGIEEEYSVANVVATKNILEAAKQNKVKRFINISSPSIYFDYKDQFDLNETDLPRKFSNAYALTKFQAEKLVKSAHTSNFLTISLRPRGVIGAGDKNWLPRIINMQKSGTLVQPGYGENLADFTCVENLLDVIEICLTTSENNMGEVYNITNGSPEKLWFVIEESLKLVGVSSIHKKVFLSVAMSVAKISELIHTLKKTKEEPTLLPIKVGVAAYSMTLDISKAKDKLGYKPKQTTIDGLREFAEWFKKQR